MSAEEREVPDEVCGEPMPVLVSQIPKSCTLPKNHDVHRCRGTAWSTDWDAWRAEIEQEVRAKVAEGLSKAAAGYRRSAKRGGVLQYEMERRATILEFHAERIARGTS